MQHGKRRGKGSLPRQVTYALRAAESQELSILGLPREPQTPVCTVFAILKANTLIWPPATGPVSHTWPWWSSSKTWRQVQALNGSHCQVLTLSVWFQPMSQLIKMSLSPSPLMRSRAAEMCEQLGHSSMQQEQLQHCSCTEHQGAVSFLVGFCSGV